MTDKTRNNEEIRQAALNLVRERAIKQKANEIEEQAQKEALIKKTNMVIHDDFTATGNLQYGIYFEGKLHKSFKIRLIMVSDTMKNKQEGYLFTLETFTAPIISLGEIPQEKLSLEFFQEYLPSRDLDTLIEVQSEIRKKRENTSGV